MTSASFSGGHFNLPDERTRIVPYCHTGFPATLTCDTSSLIAEVTGPQHLSGRIIRSFLAGTAEWRTLGSTPRTDPELRAMGGLRFAFRDAMDRFFTSVSDIFFGPPQASLLTATLDRGPDGIFVRERMAGGGYQYVIRNQGQDIPVSGDVLVGGTTLFTVKYPPLFYRAIPSAGLVDTLSLAPGSLITIFGKGLASRAEQARATPLPVSLGGASVSVNGSPIPLVYASDGQINAVLPSGLTGLARLNVQSPEGRVSTNIMLEPAVPAIFTINGAGTGPAAAVNAVTGKPVSPATPVTTGDYMSLYVTGLGDTRFSGGLQTALLTPELLVGGVRVPVSFAGRAPGFPGLDQINFQITSAVPRGLSIPLVIRVGGRASNLVSLAIR